MGDAVDAAQWGLTPACYTLVQDVAYDDFGQPLLQVAMHKSTKTQVVIRRTPCDLLFASVVSPQRLLVSRQSNRTERKMEPVTCGTWPMPLNGGGIGPYTNAGTLILFLFYPVCLLRLFLFPSQTLFSSFWDVLLFCWGLL